jgi:Zn-dependent M28 family amino/carboxypeptidase
MNWIPGSNEPKLAPLSRLHAPGAMQAADQMILQGFRDCGWEAQIRPFAFTHAAGFLDHGEASSFTNRTIYERLEGANVVAIKAGEESTDAIVVFGHHDTVRDSPGANNNTASVAVVLELTRALASSRFRRTIVLAATDMEEVGFFGGRALVAELTQERTILGAVNYETMACTSYEPGSQTLPAGIELIFNDQARRVRSNHFKGEFTTFIYNGPAARLAAAIASGLVHLAGEQAALMLRDPNDLPLIGGLLRRAVPAVRNFARSDHVPFWEVGIPALMVTDTANFRYTYYHTPGDTPEKLDYQRLAAIGCATAAGLAQFAGLIL